MGKIDFKAIQQDLIYIFDFRNKAYSFNPLNCPNA